MVLTDAVARMCPGVLSDEVCFTEESIFSGLLEYPHYTRPEVWEGEPVPEVLLSGHHKNISEWRHQQSLELTKERRPDLFSDYVAANPEEFAPKKPPRRRKKASAEDATDIDKK